MAFILGAEGAFVHLSEMVLAGSSGFSDQMLGAGVLKVGEVFELLATEECF